MQYTKNTFSVLKELNGRRKDSMNYTKDKLVTAKRKSKLLRLPIHEMGFAP